MMDQRISKIDICNEFVTIQDVDVITLMNGQVMLYDEYNRLMKEIKDRLEFLTPIEG